MVGVSVNECPLGRFRLRRDNDPSKVLSVRKEPQLSLPPAVSGKTMSVGAGERQCVFGLQPVFAEVYWSPVWGNFSVLFLGRALIYFTVIKVQPSWKRYRLALTAAALPIAGYR